MASTAATPPPRRLFPSPVRNGGSSGNGDDGVVPPSTPGGDDDPNSSSAASWRTLTPQPKSNAVPKSPFEALVFHRLVDYLQEEQLNQSLMSQQQQQQQQRSQPAATTAAMTDHPNNLPPDVVQEMDDSDSVTSTIDPHHDDHQREATATTRGGYPSPVVPIVDHHSTTSSVVVLTPRRKDYDAVNKRNEDDEPELDASRDCTEDAEIWQWGSCLHHPQLAQFPDVGKCVGSVDLMHFSSSLLVKRDVTSLPSPRPSTTNNSNSNKGKQHETESNDNGAVAAWSVMLGHNDKNRRSGSGSSSIRLIDLEAMGQIMSGRIHRDQQHYFIFTGRIRLWRLQPDGTTTPRLYDGHEHVIVPPYTPHLVEAVDDDDNSSSSSSAVILAAWSSTSSVPALAPPVSHEQNECDYYTFQPYDDLAAQQQVASNTATTIEDTFNKSSSTEKDDKDSSSSPWKQFPGSAIAKMVQAVGKKEVFWVGMAAGISFGFWFGSRRRR